MEVFAFFLALYLFFRVGSMDAAIDELSEEIDELQEQVVKLQRIIDDTGLPNDLRIG
jgi:hypothetical protein